MAKDECVYCGHELVQRDYCGVQLHVCTNPACHMLSSEVMTGAQAVAAMTGNTDSKRLERELLAIDIELEQCRIRLCSAMTRLKILIEKQKT